MNRAQCRYNSVIFPMPARMRPYSSPVRASYGVSLRGFKVWYVFCPVDAATYAISYYTEQNYNGTRMGPRHFFFFFVSAGPVVKILTLDKMSQLFRFKCLPSGDVCFNTLRPKQNGRHFPDDIFKCIYLNEKCMNLD